MERTTKALVIVFAVTTISAFLTVNTCESMTRAGRRGHSHASSFAAKHHHTQFSSTASRKAFVLGSQAGNTGSSQTGSAGKLQSSATRREFLSTTNNNAGQTSTGSIASSAGIVLSRVQGNKLLPDRRMPPDPSDFDRGMDDFSHFPGRDWINGKYLGGPDREYNSRFGSEYDYWLQNQLSDVSHASCRWDFATWDKLAHWGGPGNPLISDTTTGNWRCYADFHPDGSKSNSGKDSGNKDSGGKDSSKDNDASKDTKSEDKVVKEESSKPGDKGSKGTEGDDPDEFKSPVSQGMRVLTTSEFMTFKNALSNYGNGSGSGNSNNGSGTGLTRSGTNTPRGLPSTIQHRIGPDHKNRPDISASPAAAAVAVGNLNVAAFPTPDGGSNPPGPEFSPGVSNMASFASSTTAAMTGQASSPSVGDGGNGGIPPGPKF